MAALSRDIWQCTAICMGAYRILERALLMHLMLRVSSGQP
jgi:hypothetical protein